MGDPKFPRRRYDTPSHPWQADRIAAEKAIVRKYGLKNKTEVWKAQTRLRSFRATARQLLSKQETGIAQIDKESQQLLARLNRMGLLGQTSTLDDVLGLDLEHLLTRRLQTIVYLKGLAGSPKQARQFITHGHVVVGGRRVNVPSYIVTREEETAIELNPGSAVADPAHPVRAKPDALGGEERPAARRGPKVETPADQNPDAEADIPLDAPADEAAADEGGDAA